MNDGFVAELKALLSADFTGQIILHVSEGCVKQYEVLERRRPRADQVDLTEAGKGK